MKRDACGRNRKEPFVDCHRCGKETYQTALDDDHEDKLKAGTLCPDWGENCWAKVQPILHHVQIGCVDGEWFPIGEYKLT